MDREKPDSSSSGGGSGSEELGITDSQRPITDGLRAHSGLSTVVGGTNRTSVSHFALRLTGRIESAEIFGQREVYCKYMLVYGPDWEFTAGLDEGVSQITEKDFRNGTFIFNFPLEMSFKSSNPHGWPQLVVCVYGSDFLGNHVVRGYASTHLPLSHGSFTKILPLFVPESSSFLQKLSSWLLGRRPEFVDPKIVAQNDGRQLVRVNSSGSVRCKFEVVLKDFGNLGYVTSATVHEEETEG